MVIEMSSDGNRAASPNEVTCPTQTINYPTLAQVRGQLETWDDLSQRQRACMRSALKFLERVMGLPAMLVTLDPAVIGPKLEGASAAAYGIGARSLPTYKVQIRAAMRRLHLIDLPVRLRDPLSPAWAALRAKLPDHHLSLRLQDFMQVCDANAIAPNKVNESAVLLYAQTLRERRLTSYPSTARAKVVQAWNRAATTVPGWPQIPLANPITRARKTIPPADWSKPFAEDFARFAREASLPTDGGYFTAASAGPVLRASTIESRRTGIRMAVTHFVALGHRLEDLTALDQLLVPAVMEQILERAWVANGRRQTATLKQLGDTLRCIARYRHPEDSAVVTEARRLAKLATPPKQKGLSRRTEDRLMQFLDHPDRRAALLQLPAVLLEDAQEQKDAGLGARAGWTAAVATAIAIELRCPLRLRALTNLRMGEELVRTGGDGARWTQFVIGEALSKTGEPLRWPVAPKLSKTIDEYVSIFRPLGPHADTHWLFPARDTALAPRAQGGLGRAISEAIYRYTGAEASTHLFRSFAGMLILEEDPGALDDLRRLLGHSGLDTALRHYAFRQQRSAAARIDALLEGKATEARDAGLHALERWRPRRRPSAPGRKP
jgi:integrase